VESHFASDVPELAHLEMGSAHPGLDRSEGVLDGASSSPHHVGRLVHTGVHRFDQMLVFLPGDAALLASRAAGFEAAELAIVLPVAAVHEPLFFAGVTIGQHLTGRAGVSICLGVVDEVCLHEQRPRYSPTCPPPLIEDKYTPNPSFHTASAVRDD